MASAGQRDGHFRLERGSIVATPNAMGPAWSSVEQRRKLTTTSMLNSSTMLPKDWMIHRLRRGARCAAPISASSSMRFWATNAQHPLTALHPPRLLLRFVISSALLVELPGIEPAAEIVLTCRDADFLRRETTRKYAKRPADTREVLMASTRKTSYRHHGNGRRVRGIGPSARLRQVEWFRFPTTSALFQS